MIELEDLCYELVISKWPVDEAIAMRIVAEHFRDFIERTPKPA
jgi:hypothetical protein